MAYGARLESVLGASPRGFESPILRHRTPGPLQVPGFLLPVAPRDLRPPRVLPAREPSAPRVVACGAAGVLGAVGPGRPRDRHTRASLGVVDLEARPGPATAHRHRSHLHPAGLAPPSTRAATHTTAAIPAGHASLFLWLLRLLLQHMTTAGNTPDEIGK